MKWTGNLLFMRWPQWKAALRFFRFASALCCFVGLGIASISAAEPAPRICAGIEQALADLLTTQALKTAEQIVQAQADVGLTDQVRLAIAMGTTRAAVLRQVRAKYDPTLKARAKAVLLLAGCP